MNTTPLTEDELEAIRHRVEAATPGPWGCCYGDHCIWIDNEPSMAAAKLTRPAILPPGSPKQTVYASVGGPNRENDSAFIAAAREDVIRLLATIEAQRTERLLDLEESQ